MRSSTSGTPSPEDCQSYVDQLALGQRQPRLSYYTIGSLRMIFDLYYCITPWNSEKCCFYSRSTETARHVARYVEGSDDP